MGSSEVAALQSLADTQLAQKISQLQGVGLISLGGGNRRVVRIRFSPLATLLQDTVTAYERRAAETLLGIEQNRLVASVALVKALGGGFSACLVTRSCSAS